jgi:hypothetical protein
VSVFTPTKRQKIPGNLLSRVAEIKILEIHIWKSMEIASE